MDEANGAGAPPSAVQPAANWYPDPELSNTLRYWDGSQWTDHRAPVARQPAAAGSTKRRGPRKMTWVLIIWCALILVWAIAGGSNADCGEERNESLRSACEAGAGIGILLILLIGFFGFVFLSIIWFMTRPKD